VKCGRVKDARQVFDELPNKHIVTWNSMISSYTSLKRSKEAIGLYERMVLEGVLPDEYTFSSVFKAFSDLGIVDVQIKCTRKCMSRLQYNGFASAKSNPQGIVFF
jgi:pentatricopeptide repeat protein